MTLFTRIFFITTFILSSSIVIAAENKSKEQNYKAIRADILATITSINEIRLIMINSELKGDGSNSGNGDGKTVTRLTTNVSENNKVLKELSNKATSNNIRLSILENSNFADTGNDFSDYVTVSSKKVFNIKLVQNRNDSIECDPISDTVTYVRTQNNNSTDIVETITRYDISGKVCFERDVTKRKTDTELLYISNQNRIYNDVPVNDFVTYTNPVVLLTSSMEKGKSFGSGGIVNYNSNGSNNVFVFNKVSTILDNEAEITLTVNQAEKTYLNCLIIGTRSNSTVSTEWYCPGDGLVKRVIFYPSAANKSSRSEIITLKYIEQF